MLKAYIGGWKVREEQKEPPKIEYSFASRSEDAAYWTTREEAQKDCVIFEHHHIMIPSSQGGTHVLSGFKVEERAPGEFVVFCVGPFIAKTKGESSSEQ